MNLPGHITNYVSPKHQIRSSAANSPWKGQGTAPTQRCDDLCSCVFPPQRAQRHTGDGCDPSLTIAEAEIHLDLKILPDPGMLQSGIG